MRAAFRPADCSACRMRAGAPAAVVVSSTGWTSKCTTDRCLSWLLHTAAGNRLECGRDRVSIVGCRRENRCDVQSCDTVAGPLARREVFHDHPQAAVRLVLEPALLHRGARPLSKRRWHLPKSTATGDRLGLRHSHSHRATAADTVLTAGPGKYVYAFNDVRTDAEFAHVRTVDDNVDTGLLAAGSVLEVSRCVLLVSEPGPIDYHQL